MTGREPAETVDLDIYGRGPLERRTARDALVAALRPGGERAGQDGRSGAVRPVGWAGGGAGP